MYTHIHTHTHKSYTMAKQSLFQGGKADSTFMYIHIIEYYSITKKNEIMLFSAT